MEYLWIDDANAKQTICKEVLADLPEWFGIPSAVDTYVGNVKDKPFLAVYDNEETVGFYALREENPYTLDMYVLGIKKAYHKQGIGSRMQSMVNRYAFEVGYRNLVVLTLSEKATSEAYSKTRAFYERMGFSPVYQSDKIWGESNPTVIYVKQIDRQSVMEGAKIHLNTGRLLIRSYKKSDLEDFHRIFSDPEVMESSEAPYTKAKSESTLRQFIDSKIAYAVVHKKDGVMIGHLLFKQMPSSESGVYEIGWFLSRSYWNQGYAFEAAKAIMHHGFETLGVHKVVAETTDPVKSLPLMKKLGMTQEGTMRNQVKHDDEWLDLYVAGMIAHEHTE